MPTRDRVRGTLVETSEQLSQIGYEAEEIVGPVNSDGEEIPLDEVEERPDEDVRYYIIGSSETVSFYILYQLDKNFAMIVYPMNVFSHLSSYLNEEEVETILEESIDWDGISPQRKENINRKAIQKIVEQTDPLKYHRAAFNLSVYASTALVDYNQMTTDEGFPIEFQCVRGMFPYTEQISMSRIDDRVHPVLIAGERGRRYIEYSFRIDKEDKNPKEYKFAALI